MQQMATGRDIGDRAALNDPVNVPRQQRKFCFPEHCFGSRGEKRSVKATSFDSWAWLDYEEVSDSVICFYCSYASSRRMLSHGLYGKREEASCSCLTAVGNVMMVAAIWLVVRMWVKAHALSLSIADTVRLMKGVRSKMDTVHELSKLLLYSPKRATLFKDVKAEISPDSVGFHILCPTRWTVRNQTFNSILQNYNALLQVWETILGNTPDSETRACVNGIDSQMKTFDFYFGACLIKNILSHTDNLSKTLQHSTMSAAEGQRLVQMTTTTLHSIRSEEGLNYFGRKL